MTHRLKILPKYFEPVINGSKTFELRKNDRDFKIGDVLSLQECIDNAYTGRKFITTISYVLKNCKRYGLMDGYAVIGFN